MGAIQYAERQEQKTEEAVETTANENVEQVVEETPKFEEVTKERSLWARIMNFFTGR